LTVEDFLKVEQSNHIHKIGSIKTKLKKEVFSFHSRKTHEAPVEDYMPYQLDGGYDEESPYYRDYNITYLLNPPHMCTTNTDDEGPTSNNPLYLIVVVHSHTSHIAQRDAIRDTWGKARRDFDAPLQVRIVFILGQSESDLALTGPKKESKLYRDIVLGTFMDSYRNLTLKSLFGLQWVLEYCEDAKYILKTDDDSYFNLTSLLHLLPMVKDSKFIGSLNTKAPVQRHGLWQVNQAQFPQKTYPPYCSGCAYVVSQDILPQLLSTARSIPMLPIEDVYVTGLLAKALRIQCQNNINFPYWYMGPSPKHICMLLNGRIFGLHNVQYERMYTIFHKVNSGHTCSK
jgi:hypothetical protein